MTPKKQEQKLRGQSGLARRVFQFVPIDTDWTIAQMIGEASRKGASIPDVRAVEAVLGQMLEAGLIRKVTHKTFQRTAVSEPIKLAKDLPHAASEPISPPAKEVKEEPTGVGLLDDADMLVYRTPKEDAEQPQPKPAAPAPIAPPVIVPAATPAPAPVIPVFVPQPRTETRMTTTSTITRASIKKSSTNSSSDAMRTMKESVVQLRNETREYLGKVDELLETIDTSMLVIEDEIASANKKAEAFANLRMALDAVQLNQI